LLPLIQELKAAHPFWGYRRVWASLKYAHGLVINQKRVYRLLRENGLLVAGREGLKARRERYPNKPRADKPNQWWGIDMTKVMTGEGWAYVVIVNDWFSKKLLGCHVGSQSRAGEWLAALNQAVCRQFPGGVREARPDLHLMSDNGSQPTSLRFMRECGELGVEQCFTSYANPKGNADTERLIRTLKEELLWLREWPSVSSVAEAMKDFVPEFNANYLHSALGYRPPENFEREWLARSAKTHSAAA
jgi:transposase InsO family protein